MVLFLDETCPALAGRVPFSGSYFAARSAVLPEETPGGNGGFPQEHLSDLRLQYRFTRARSKL